MPPVQGIDISSFNGTLTADHWKSIAARGTRFVIARAGDGNNPVDTTWENRIDNAKAVGLVVGVYHLPFVGLPTDAAHPGRGAAEQARAHFTACGGLGSADGDLPASIDLEYPAPSLWGKPIPGIENSVVTQAAALEWAETYLETYEALQGKSMIVYGSPWFLNSLQVPASWAARPLWLAEYTAVAPTPPKPWKAYTFWQSSGGTVQKLPNGLPVDSDACCDEDTFQKLISP